jgi:sarcosine oxidase subunit delta
MLRINCPICGLRDETEFSYGGDATVVRPAPDETNADVWFDFVFLRDNPRGPHREYWHHAKGCRQWLVVERDTLTHKIGGAVLARDAATEAAS